MQLLIKAKDSRGPIIEQVSSQRSPGSNRISALQNFAVDLYRVNNEVELFELGIPDIFDSQITLLEWPEILETKIC